MAVGLWQIGPAPRPHPALKLGCLVRRESRVCNPAGRETEPRELTPSRPDTPMLSVPSTMPFFFLPTSTLFASIIRETGGTVQLVLLVLRWALLALLKKLSSRVEF